MWLENNGSGKKYPIALSNNAAETKYPECLSNNGSYKKYPICLNNNISGNKVTNMAKWRQWKQCVQCGYEQWRGNKTKIQFAVETKYPK
jgi:hypothetical protein